MKVFRRVVLVGLVAALLAGSGGGALSASAASKVVAVDKHSCASARVGRVGCLAIRRTLVIGGVAAHASSPSQLIEPNGRSVFGMTALRKAYGIRALGSPKHVIAIVDAFHSGTALRDLNVYRDTFGAAAIADCSKSSAAVALRNAVSSGTPCFRQVDQRGVASTGETTDVGWAQETELDLEMASAVCPNCSLTVVEAASPSFIDFNQAVALASTLAGVVAISNSYGGPEVSEAKLMAYETAYSAGIAVVASSGDSGYGVQSPASFQHVIAVGGTSLSVDSKGFYSGERAWSGAGSGCSVGAAPEWQDNTLTHCSGKAIADVSAVADPATGVAVFYDGQWAVFGGTSASAPIVAGLFALKSNYGISGSAGSLLWSHADSLRDVVDGANGTCRWFCSSTEGWDGPPQLGSAHLTSPTAPPP